MMSNQIIDVINELCNKFGIAIDWSQKNVQPYLENLGIKAVNYELYTSIMWIVIGAFLFGLGLIYISKANKCKKKYFEEKYKNGRSIDLEDNGIWKDIFRVFAWCLFILAAIIICCNINDIIRCITFPDKVVFDMLSNYLK